MMEVIESVVTKVRDMAKGATLTSDELIQYLIELDENIQFNECILEAAMRYSSYALKSMSLTKLRIEEGEISHMTANNYAERYKQHAWYPPIFYDKMEGIMDGYHRISAIKRTGGKTIAAFIGIE